MTKDRPFKHYKTPADRPFKSYDPIRSIYDYPPDPQQPAQQQPSAIEQQSLRFTSVSSLLQQQQTPLMFSQPQQAQQSNTSNQQIYGDPEDFIHLNSQSGQSLPQSNIMSIDPSLNPYYDDLGLDDPDNPLIRPDLLVASDPLLQREQDLNIPNVTAPPNFIMPNRHSGVLPLPRIPPSNTQSSIQDTLSMLFDQPQQSVPTFTSSESSVPTSSPSNLSHPFLMSKTADTNGPLCPIASTPFLNNINPSLRDEILAGSNPSSSNGRSSSTNNGMHLPSSSFPVKQEADDGRSVLVESPSPSVQSPTQSEPVDSFSETKSKLNVKRSLSESASFGCPDQDDPSEQGTSRDVKPKCESSKDPSYLEKRRKNNESAKRSREARRSKEELVALRVITLEEENMKLRAEMSMLDKELDELRQRLFQQ